MKASMILACLVLASCVSDPIAVARDRKNYNATKIAVDKWFAGEPPPAVEPDQRITNEWLADWDARLKLLEEQK